MRIKLSALAGAFVLAAVMSGCASHRPPPGGRQEEEWHSPVEILLRYAGPDGTVTRAGMEAGLRKDFDAADTNHDGVLEPDEARTVNEQRWNDDRSAISPLQDWNGDGVIDFNEFAATARTLFRELDRNGDGVLTPQELRPDRAGQRPSGNDQDQQDEGRRGGHGRRGGGRVGPPGGDGPPEGGSSPGSDGQPGGY